MKRGVRCRGIVLLPPNPEDVKYVAAAHDQEDVWRMFGLDGSGRLRFLQRERSGDLEVGIIHRGSARIGFSVVYPPRPAFAAWELTFAVPERADRDAYSAMAAADAVAFSLFEERGLDSFGFRTRPDNRAAEAVLRRMGYRPVGEDEYRVWKIDRAAFEPRRLRLGDAIGFV
jgi:RimJ/RimL family protein N-acetyltransferase